jgi:hypothetical protein
MMPTFRARVPAPRQSVAPLAVNGAAPTGRCRSVQPGVQAARSEIMPAFLLREKTGAADPP